MSVKKIITVPDESLRKISEPIENFGINEKKLVKNLFDTMYSANGIGLAAIQIGIPKRVVVLDVSKDDKKKEPYCFINPIIKKKKYWNFCLWGGMLVNSQYFYWDRTP